MKWNLLWLFSDKHNPYTIYRLEKLNCIQNVLLLEGLVLWAARTLQYPEFAVVGKVFLKRILVSFIYNKNKSPCIISFLLKYNIHSVYYLLFQRDIYICKDSKVCKLANNMQSETKFEQKFSAMCQILNNIRSYTFTFRKAHGWMRQTTDKWRPRICNIFSKQFQYISNHTAVRHMTFSLAHLIRWHGSLSHLPDLCYEILFSRQR